MNKTTTEMPLPDPDSPDLLRLAQQTPWWVPHQAFKGGKIHKGHKGSPSAKRSRSRGARKRKHS